MTTGGLAVLHLSADIFFQKHQDDSRSPGVTNRAITPRWTNDAGRKTKNMKTYPKINYAFRPKSYWADVDLLAAILRNVAGENRRRMIRDYWAAGKLDELDPALLAEEVDEDTRQLLGQIHPSFMGGEYLPGYRPGEVEIARISLQSTTGDVFSLRARPLSKRIGYRVVDEYQSKYSLPIKTSKKPLTLAEVIRQLDEGTGEGVEGDGGLSLGPNIGNAGDGDFEGLRHFTTISSPFYPGLEGHFEHVFEEWVATSVAERDRAAGSLLILPDDAPNPTPTAPKADPYSGEYYDKLRAIGVQVGSATWGSGLTVASNRVPGKRPSRATPVASTPSSSGFSPTTAAVPPSGIPPAKPSPSNPLRDTSTP